MLLSLLLKLLIKIEEDFAPENKKIDVLMYQYYSHLLRHSRNIHMKCLRLPTISLSVMAQQPYQLSQYLNYILSYS